MDKDKLKKEFADTFGIEITIDQPRIMQIKSYKGEQICDFWLQKISERDAELIKKIEGLKKKVITNMLQDDILYQERGMDGVKGFNQAIDTVLSIIKKH